MSITTRLYSKNELESIKDARKEFKTVFANKQGYSGEEIKALCKIQGEIKTYVVQFVDEVEPMTFKAIDDESALWFLKQEYKPEYIERLAEKIVNYRTILG